MIDRPSEELLKLFRLSGDSDQSVAQQAQRQIAKAIEEPLRKGIMYGDVTGNIFERMQLEPGSSPEFPLDLLSPGTERDYTAYTNPGHGRIPERSVESDYVMVHTYSITNSIDFQLKYAYEARWDIAQRATKVMAAGFVKKINDDAWHTILAAAVDRDILVYDDDAANGQFTKRLISLGKTLMLRNGGGNSVTATGRLTDLYMSPEGIEDVRNWGIDQLDEVSRREVYQSAENGAPLTRIFGVNLNGLFEFGDGQEYQTFVLSDLGGALASGDVELIIGLDLNARDSFVMPIKRPLEIFEDMNLHRQQRQGYYGWQDCGFAVLDNRRVIALSF